MLGIGESHHNICTLHYIYIYIYIYIYSYIKGYINYNHININNDNCDWVTIDYYNDVDGNVDDFNINDNDDDADGDDANRVSIFYT